MIDSLHRHAVKHIFGYPGGAILPIYDELYRWEAQGKIQHILVRHEQASGHATEYLGFLAGLIALIMSFLVIYWRIFAPNSPLAGYTMVILTVLFLSAAQLITIGILGEYIGRIYEEVKARPLFTVSEVCGFASQEIES